MEERGKKVKEKSVCEIEQEWEWEQEREKERWLWTTYPRSVSDCEPGKKTKWSLSDITNWCKHDRLGQMPRWAGELVHYVRAGIVRCQEPLSSQLKRGVDVVQLRVSLPPWLSIRIALPFFYPAYVKMERSLRLASFALGWHSRSSGSPIVLCLKIVWEA